MARFAGAARSSAIRRLAASAVVTLVGVGALRGLGLPGAAFSSRPAMLERLGAPVQATAVGRQASEGAGALEPALELESGSSATSTLRMAQDPQWATCFVQAQRTSRAVLEEWVLRGERENVAAFRAWRQDSPEPTSVRCVELEEEEEALRTVCLECASPGGAAPAGALAPGAFAGVAFGGLSQCMAHAAVGLGFCKSGQVSMGY
uniref:Uncharacterized protein n=1 Tax=Alexandrium monilatum TaxID=311494 RepID=A0A7S4V034_9DINO